MKHGSCCMIFLLHIIILRLTRAVEITVAPTSQVALLGERPHFFCEANGGTPRWIINQIQFDTNIHLNRGIDRHAFRVMGRLQQTTLEVHATVENNNTELRCRVSEQVQSAAIFLQVQGYLDAPPNLTVTVLNSTVAHLTWAAPFTLDLPEGIVAYNITIQDFSLDEFTLVTNTTTSEYYFLKKDCSPLKNYTALIAGVNGLGVGDFGNIVFAVHGFLDSNITVSHNNFTCETLCDDSLLVTWMINRMFLSQLGNQLSVRTETNYPLQCDSGSQGSATYTSTLQVLSDTDTPLPVPYTVQCVAVATCNRDNETTPCTPKICYSNHIIHAEGTEDAVSELLTTATDFQAYSNTTSMHMEISQSDSTILVTVSSAAGILFITCVSLLLCSSVVCYKMVARGKTATANSTQLPATMKIEEVIYEECGVAVATVPASRSSAHVTQAPHHVTQAPPSPPPPVIPPTLQLCQAYEPSGQPKTDVNIAYATSGQPQTDRNVAYTTPGQPQT